MKKKNCKVIIIPSSKPTELYIGGGSGKLYHTLGHIPKNDRLNVFYHLYILSNDEIKEGDWCYANQGNEIFQWNYKGKPAPECFAVKIIAKTDQSLIKCKFCDNINNKIRNHLFNISQQFIEQYIERFNKGNIITSCLVEYEKINLANKGNKSNNSVLSNCNNWIDSPKLTKNNEIIIELVKEKVYSIEQLKLAYFTDSEKYGDSSDKAFYIWIKENL